MPVSRRADVAYVVAVRHAHNRRMIRKYSGFSALSLRKVVQASVSHSLRYTEEVWRHWRRGRPFGRPPIICSFLL
jgi:predicted solute-binding protein